jgi:Ca2+-binding RTX toxin-like protein
VIGDLNADGNPDLITSNSGAGNVTVLTAIPPTVNFTPVVAFGNQPPNVASAEQPITFRNDGPQRLRFGLLTLAGANAVEFSVAGNTCSGSVLPVGGTCRIGVRFTPNGLGARSAAVSITSNGGGSPHVVQLTGTGAFLPGRCANVRNGTARPDTLTGTPAGDKLVGLGGNDVLNGLAGADCLIGGTGADRLSGGSGADLLEGSSGNDTASGGTGNDNLSGGSGRDRLSGGTGNDRLTGGSGNDRMTGGPGRNRYSGGAGNDRISAVNHRVDRIDCGRGRRDRATVDRRDRVKHCELVARRRR